MAFSIRKMLSNINYFKKPDGSDDSAQPDLDFKPVDNTESMSMERKEADSTSVNYASSLSMPVQMKKVSTKISLSDTDILTVATPEAKQQRRKMKKLKLDVQKANLSVSEGEVTDNEHNNIENTPKDVLLGCRSADVFRERIKQFDFSQSFEIFDAMSDEPSSSFDEENVDIESLSDESDTDISLASEDEKESIKMCRKVETAGSGSTNDDNLLVPSISPESFGDVELDKNEDERTTLLLTYQMKFEKLENYLKKMLTEFQFHIEISKVFNFKGMATPTSYDYTNMKKAIFEIANNDNFSRGVTPTGSWNIVLDKVDVVTKNKVRNQMLSIKQMIETFINNCLLDSDKTKKYLSKNRRSITFDFHEGERVPHKKLRISNKKKHKHFDFPDIRESMISLFCPENQEYVNNNDTHITDFTDVSGNCGCRCHCASPTDSGLTTKNDDMSSQSITSSLGNFSLDSSTLTAYSDSLDLIVSYNSFQDSSLYNMLLQKAAIERITFYVQVHSIQLQCELNDNEYESKNTIIFYCPSCKCTENDENGLLKHILSPDHCVKIHFLYKTAYIKKCMSSGKEIMPSTVLNPMTMYRDENKIVCFGDAVYACSLCFENLIVGESVLMAHCSDPEHIDRREKLTELLDN